MSWSVVFNKLLNSHQCIIQSVCNVYVDIVLSMVKQQMPRHKNQQQAYVVDYWDILRQNSHNGAQALVNLVPSKSLHCGMENPTVTGTVWKRAFDVVGWDASSHECSDCFYSFLWCVSVATVLKRLQATGCLDQGTFARFRSEPGFKSASWACVLALASSPSQHKRTDMNQTWHG